MPKGKGKAVFKGGRGSKNAAQDGDAMAFKRASRVNKITSAHDAGFEGQDAFGLGDDEIALDGHANGANGELTSVTLLAWPLVRVSQHTRWTGCDRGGSG